jgi:hypothetical protein
VRRAGFGRFAAGGAGFALAFLGLIPVAARASDPARLPAYHVLAGLFHIKVSGSVESGIVDSVILVGVKPDARIGEYSPRNGDELIAINGETVPGMSAERFLSFGRRPEGAGARNTLTFRRWHLFRSHTFVVSVAELSIE